MSVAPGCESYARPDVAAAHVLSRVPILVLNVHSRCNCRCVMCDIWKRTESEELDRHLLAKQLEAVRALGVEWVVFSGGEPLMHSDLPEIAKLFRLEGIRLTLLTTGILLAQAAESVATHFDEVIVSLDGPPDIHDRIRRVPGAFEKLAAGVRAVREISPQLPICARTTVQKSNFAYLLETVTTARELGLTSLSFLAADLTSTAFNRELVWPVRRQEQIGLDPNDLDQLREKIEMLIALHSSDIQQGFIAESQAKLRRIVRHFEAHLGMHPPMAPRCNAPWVSAVIEANGDVRPCFFHPAVGNLHDHDVSTVLNGPHGMAFRESLDVESNTTCQRCVCSIYREETSMGQGSPL